MARILILLFRNLLFRYIFGIQLKFKKKEEQQQLWRVCNFSKKDLLLRHRLVKLSNFQELYFKNNPGQPFLLQLH